MKHTFRMAGLLLGATLCIASLPVLADSAAPATSSVPDHTGRQARHERRIESRLARIADLLELNDAQRQGSAWQNFAQAIRDLATRVALPHDPNADAATVMRARADAAKLQANKLARLADATQALQLTLTEPQRKVLAEWMRHAKPFHRPMHHRRVAIARGPNASDAAR